MNDDGKCIEGGGKNSARPTPARRESVAIPFRFFVYVQTYRLSVDGEFDREAKGLGVAVMKIAARETLGKLPSFASGDRLARTKMSRKRIYARAIIPKTTYLWIQ